MHTVQTREMCNVLVWSVAISPHVLPLQNKTPRELFSQYDTNSDGFLDQVEQWRMLKVTAARTSSKQGLPRGLYGPLSTAVRQCAKAYTYLTGLTPRGGCRDHTGEA
jgi:hypothetical protein